MPPSFILDYDAKVFNQKRRRFVIQLGENTAKLELLLYNNNYLDFSHALMVKTCPEGICLHTCLANMNTNRESSF